VAEVLEGEEVGVALRSLNESSMTLGLKKLLQLAHDPFIRVRCAAAAEKHFSLDEGVARYKDIYQTIEL
jgi:glycogen synthase